MIYYKKLASWIDPQTLFSHLYAQEKCAFWLDSSLSNDTTRFSYMGTPQHTITYSLKQNRITKTEQDTQTNVTQDIFTYLEKELKTKNEKNTSLPFPFIGGYVGYFGYELKQFTGGKTTYSSPYPDSLWYFIDKTIVFDHKKNDIYLVCVTNQKKDAEEWFKRVTNKVLSSRANLSSSEDESRRHHVVASTLGVDLLPRIPGDNRSSNISLTSLKNKDQYFTNIASCKEYLRKGESYQICLTNKLTTTSQEHPLTIYQRLRNINPAPYGAYLRYNDLSILCSSPEQFLTITQDRLVETKPIKGTISRGRTTEEDTAKIQELKENKKEWSENAMIVDLLRNDLGKVCQFGSIEVTKKLAIESYATVHHLVSTIQGKLRPDCSIIDCIKACFPGGSMTGAPKIRTVEILDELEGQARGIYSGSLGFLSLNQTASLNIIIRTMVMTGKKIEIGAGGAILIDSDPEKEYDEMLLKTKALRKALTKNYE